MPSHGSEVAARLALVRRLIDEASNHRLSPSPLCARGVEAIERWLRGEDVTFEELEKLNDDARAEQQRVWAAREPAWKFHSNLASALVNLSCFVLKVPGWKKASRGLVENVMRGLDSLESEVDLKRPLRISNELEAALANLKDTPAFSKLKSPRGASKPKKLRAKVGDAIGERLERLGAMVDAKLRGASVVPWPAVVAFDERWGGTIFAGDGGDEWNVLLGSHGCSTYKTAMRDGRVPVARGPDDEIYYADETGAVFTHDGAAFAPTLEAMLERIVAMARG